MLALPLDIYDITHTKEEQTANRPTEPDETVCVATVLLNIYLLCAYFCVLIHPASIWLFHHFGLLLFLRGRLLQIGTHN